jgi:hypothetical protein
MTIVRNYLRAINNIMSSRTTLKIPDRAASWSVLGPEFISPKKKRQSPIEFRPSWGPYNKQYYSCELVCYIVCRTWSQAQGPLFLELVCYIVWRTWSQAQGPLFLGVGVLYSVKDLVPSSRAFLLGSWCAYSVKHLVPSWMA